MSEDRKTESFLTFSGIFDEQVARLFFGECAQAMAAGIQKLHILIQSPGGVIGVGVTLYNYLRGLPIEVITYNGGSVESVAVIVYLAGNVRRASETATFLTHATSVELRGIYRGDFIRSRLAIMERDDVAVESILKRHIRIPDDKWEVHKAGDLVIPVVKAQEWGLVHEVADFKPLAGYSHRNINI